MSNQSFILSILQAAPCTHRELWDAYQTIVPDASRIVFGLELQALAKAGTIHLVDGAWKMTEEPEEARSPVPDLSVPDQHTEDQPVRDQPETLRDLERAFSEWLAFGQEWMRQGEALMQQVPQVLAQAEKERADMQQDRERLKKAREAVLAAAMHLEEQEIPDGIQRSWGIPKT
ncbi:hypothetical protein ACSSZE_03160 [Acidithiobacillus caldus]